MLAQFVLTTIYVTLELASGSPTFGRYPRSETTHLDQLVQDSNNASEVQTEVLQPARNLSMPEKQLLKELIARFRQDEGDTGLQVGQSVGAIISGVLGGGVENIFQGSSNFISNANVQEEAEFVIGNVAPVVDTVLKYGFNGIKQYLGIGTTTTTTEATTTPETEQAPILIPIYINPNQSQLTLAQQEQLYQQQLIFEIQNLQQKLQEASKDETTSSSSDPDAPDLDIVEENREELLANYPLLVRSRVEIIR